MWVSSVSLCRFAGGSCCGCCCGFCLLALLWRMASATLLPNKRILTFSVESALAACAARAAAGPWQCRRERACELVLAEVV